MKRALVPCLAAAFALACADQSPIAPPFDGPSTLISDGTQLIGNPDFFFLPPMVPDPSGDPDFEAGKFNGSLGPLVQVCELTATGCGTIVASFTRASGLGSETIRVNTTDEYYIVNWHTDLSSPALDPTKTYRIVVSVGSEELGFADIDVVSSGKELRSVETGQYIPLLDGRTLPIKFRVEDGALCDPPGSPTCSSGTVNLAEGGTVVFEPTRDRLDVPPQDTPAQESITFTLTLCDGIDVDLPTFGKCLHIDADPPQTQAFSPRATISICSALPGDLVGLAPGQDDLLLLHRQDDAGNVQALPKVPGFCTTTVGNAGSNVLMRFARAVRDGFVRMVAPLPLFARSGLVAIDVGGGGESPFTSDFQFALPAQMTPVPGTDDQTGSPGQPVANPPAVHVTAVNGSPVFNARVHFEVTDGGGTVTPMVVFSGSNGIAAVQAWTLGSASGTHTLRAFGKGIADPADGGPFVPDAFNETTQTPIPPSQQTPVLLGTGEVTFTATACASQPCSAGTIDLAEGGTVVLQATGDRLDIPPQNNPGQESIRFTLELCGRINVDLPTYGNCLRITADPPQAQAFSPRATISICSALPADLAGLAVGQDDLLLLHRQDAAGNVQALPKVPGFCQPPVGDAGGSALRRFARAVRDRLVDWLAPPPLLARTRVVVIDVGGGGESPFTSDFQFALPAQMDPLPGTSGQMAAPGSAVTNAPGVMVTDRNGGLVAGATVHFQVTLGGGSITPMDVVSNAAGVAQLSQWVLGAAGANQVRAHGKGIADPLDPGPFMPVNIGPGGLPVPPDQQTPVAVGTGEVFFTATAEIPTHSRRRAGDIAIYKNYNAWFGSNKDQTVLGNPPFNFTNGVHYFVRSLSQLQNGIPAQTSLIIITSASSGNSLNQQTDQRAGAANLEAWVRGGGWLVIHAGDNGADDYIVPGLSGPADEVLNCTGLTLTAVDHALIRGPDATLGTGDDLNNANIDNGGRFCYDNHGSLAGVLPGDAQVLMTEQGGGQRPVYATYTLGNGRVIVITLTIEFSAHTTQTLINHFYWAIHGLNAPAAGAAIASASLVAGVATEGDTLNTDGTRRQP